MCVAAYGTKLEKTLHVGHVGCMKCNVRCPFLYCINMEKGLRFRRMERAIVHHGFEPRLRSKEHHSFESWFTIASSHWFPTTSLYEAQCFLSSMTFKMQKALHFLAYGVHGMQCFLFCGANTIEKAVRFCRTGCTKCNAFYHLWHFN